MLWLLQFCTFLFHDTITFHIFLLYGTLSNFIVFDVISFKTHNSSFCEQISMLRFLALIHLYTFGLIRLYICLYLFSPLSKSANCTCAAFITVVKNTIISFKLNWIDAQKVFIPSHTWVYSYYFRGKTVKVIFHYFFIFLYYIFFVLWANMIWHCCAILCEVQGKRKNQSFMYII